jgi:ferredoxin
MSERFKILKNLLEEEKCFKMICGAGNEDAPYVKKLALIYTLAGAKILDVSCNVKVIEHAMQGIDMAYKLSPELGVDIGVRPFIMASVGMPGDHHVRKSYIDPFTCIGCNMCIPVCPTEAIPQKFTEELDLFQTLEGSFEIENQSKEIVIKDLCIGCGKCSNICPKDDIISYRHNARELRELLPKCIEAGAETFELHAAVGEHKVTMEEWKLINEINPNNYNSMCLDRLNLGNSKLEYRIEEAKKISKDKLIIQADGYPMSGGKNDFNSTLQAVACADVINKKFNMRVNKKEAALSNKGKFKKEGSGKAKVLSKRIYRPLISSIPIVLSGGTNALSKELANQVGVRCNGIAIGTYARDIIEDLVSNDNFYTDINIIKEAYQVSNQLVKNNIK